MHASLRRIILTVLSLCFIHMQMAVKAALQGLKVFFVKECQRVDVNTVVQVRLVTRMMKTMALCGIQLDQPAG